MNDIANTILNTATLIAAFTAAWFSYSGLRKQGVQKIAEFRQQWIENFRIHLASFNGDIYRKEMLQLAMTKSRVRAIKDQLNDEKKHAIENAGEHYEYLKLCLNPDDPVHDQFLKKLLALLNGEPGDRRKTPSASDLGSKLLKSEWEKLKLELKK